MKLIVIIIKQNGSLSELQHQWFVLHHEVGGAELQGHSLGVDLGTLAQGVRQGQVVLLGLVETVVDARQLGRLHRLVVRPVILLTHLLPELFQLLLLLHVEYLHLKLLVLVFVVVTLGQGEVISGLQS